MVKECIQRHSPFLPIFGNFIYWKPDTVMSSETVLSSIDISKYCTGKDAIADCTVTRLCLFLLAHYSVKYKLLEISLPAVNDSYIVLLITHIRRVW